MHFMRNIKLTSDQMSLTFQFIGMHQQSSRKKNCDLNDKFINMYSRKCRAINKLIPVRHNLILQIIFYNMCNQF
jgi:hypothetical protein